MAEQELKLKISLLDEASKKLDNLSGKLKDLSTNALKVGAGMMAMGGVIVGAMWKMTDSYTKAGDEVAKMAKKTGMGVGMLSEMRHVANLSGTSLSGLEVGFKRMATVIIDASTGVGAAADAFKILGLDIDTIRAMKPEDQFWAITDALASIEDPTLKASLAVDLFGRSGTDLLPILAEGKEGIAAMRQEAHDLNIVFDEETAKAAEAFQDAQTKMKAALQGLGAAIATAVMPVLKDLIDKVTVVTAKFADWVKEHPELIKGLLLIGGLLLAGGAILMGLGMLAKAIIAINMALVILHGLSGPAGWVKLAAGIAIAAGAAFAISKIMATPQLETPTVPSMQYGGIVPGPIGQPVPIIAHGGEQFLGVGADGSRTVNINVGTLIGDEISLRRFARQIKQVLGEEDRRTTFSGINQSYFYGGSHV